MKLWFFCFLSLAMAQDVVRTADPIKRGLKLTDFPRVVQVSKNVYTYEDFHAGAEKFTTTNMFVVTRAGVVLCDAQGNPEATRKEVEAIAKITSQPIKYVVIASDHGDHTGGNSSLPPGITFFVHPTSKVNLVRESRHWTLPADAVLVTDKKVLHLGGEEIQILFLGRTHTGGDLDVYLPRQKILFLSETFANRVFPAMRTAHPTEWLKTLDRVEKIDAKIYIPGHGFTEKAAVSKEELHEYHKAIEAVIAEATRLYKAGVPVDEAVKQANWGQYSSWTLASSQGPVAVRKVYQELSGKLQ